MGSWWCIAMIQLPQIIWRLMGQAHTRAGCVHCACMPCMVHMYTHRGQPILKVLSSFRMCTPVHLLAAILNCYEEIAFSSQKENQNQFPASKLVNCQEDCGAYTWKLIQRKIIVQSVSISAYTNTPPEKPSWRWEWEPQIEIDRTLLWRLKKGVHLLYTTLFG